MYTRKNSILWKLQIRWRMSARFGQQIRQCERLKLETIELMRCPWFRAGIWIDCSIGTWLVQSITLTLSLFPNAEDFTLYEYVVYRQCEHARCKRWHKTVTSLSAEWPLPLDGLWKYKPQRSLETGWLPLAPWLHPRCSSQAWSVGYSLDPQISHRLAYAEMHCPNLTKLRKR